MVEHADTSATIGSQGDREYNNKANSRTGLGFVSDESSNQCRGHWRLIGTIVASLFVVALVELNIEGRFAPTFWERTAWLLHEPYRGESFDRTILVEKLKTIAGRNPEIITVGDSSGFFSLSPEVINSHIGARRMFNTSTGANHAFDGYLATAEYVLKRHSTVRHVVLHMFPNLVPAYPVLAQGDLGTIAATQLNSLKGIMEAPPSAMFSYTAKLQTLVGVSYNRGDQLSSHKVYLEFRNIVQQTDGWIPEHDVRFPRRPGRNEFYADRESGFMAHFSGKQLLSRLGFRDKSNIVHELSRFADLCRRYGVTPVIAFQPMMWEPSLLQAPFQQTVSMLQRFSSNNPDVRFITPYVTIWDSSKIGMFNHTSREYVHLSSGRMGVALARFLADPTKARPFEAGSFSNAASAAPSVQPIRSATEIEKHAALAFYLYTATGDDSYRSAISTRVRNIIDADPDFQTMLAATRSRLETARGASDKVEYGYDTSGLNAELVAVTGARYCGQAVAPTWIRLSGVMNFTLKSRTLNIAEPVEWPKLSDVIFPVTEGSSGPEFDGYCQESSGIR